VVAVRDDLDAGIPLNQSANVEPFGYTSTPFRVGLDEADDFALEERLDIPSRVPMFPGGEGDPCLTLESRVAFKIVWPQRLLQPAWLAGQETSINLSRYLNSRYRAP
jgi:hypothetical protein